MWSFETVNPRAMRRDPFEGEFFRGEGANDRIRGLGEALVREVIQNAIDASLDGRKGEGAGPVRIRFVLKTEAKGLPVSRAKHYFEGLEQHLAAVSLTDELNDLNEGTVPYMVIEDFGTIGLTGDVSRTTDPSNNQHAPFPECFYWFWRNIGRSGKTTEQLGRWGLGKTVLPASSRINTFFGLTRRADDNRTLLMGQSILKLHSLGGSEYLPEGFYCNPRIRELQMPLDDPGIIARFCADFGIERSTETGLSVVVPLYPNDLTGESLVKAVVSNFFVRIIRDEVNVSVQEDDGAPIEIDAGRLDAICASISWADDEETPPLAFVRSALEAQRTKSYKTLVGPTGTVAPQWTENLFPQPEERFKLYASLQAGELVSALVPMTLLMKQGPVINTTFLVAMIKTKENERGWEGYIRDGMRISRVSSGFGKLRYHGFVLVDDRALSDFLGDAEGPAHLDWAESERRPEKRYRTWPSRLRFIKRSLKSFLELITPPPETIDRALYASLFPDPTPSPSPGGQAVGPGQDQKRVPPIKIPPPKPAKFRVSQVAGGFHVVRNPDFPDPIQEAKLIVKYDSLGNAKWSAFDFSFGPMGSGINVTWANAASVEQENNVITVREPESGFSLKATGFKVNSDLIVKITP